MADSIFNAHKKSGAFSFQKVYTNKDLNNPRVAVFIGHLFNGNQRNAIVMYSTGDGTLDLNLFQSVQAEWSLVQQQTIPFGDTGPSDKFVSFGHLNEDSTNELLILTSVWLIRSGEIFKAFQFKNNRLIEVSGFEEFPNPKYDDKTKRIYAYMGNGCGDMNMVFRQGIIRNNALIIETSINCDCCTEKGDVCTIYINKKSPVVVPIDSSYKYVMPYYQDYLKTKLKGLKEN